MEKSPELQELDDLYDKTDKMADMALKKAVVLLNPDINVSDTLTLEDLARNVILPKDQRF